MKEKLSIKQVLVDLISILPQLVNYYSKDKKYKTLLNFLTEKDYYNDEDLPYPTLKEIVEATGLKSHTLRKQLQEMYESFYAYDNDFGFSFQQVVINVFATYHKESILLKFKNLKYLPRVGDRVELPFVQAKLNISFFYVEKIEHSFESNNQVIDIVLKGGTYSKYWEYRKSKALATGEIGFREEYDLYDFQLKEKLGLRGI